MITRADVADLRVGDVVEITEVDTDGCIYTHRGPVKLDGPRKDGLAFCDLWLRNEKGDPGAWIEALTVVSRAPRPLYVNHDRTEPVPGDVVRDADDADSPLTWAAWQDGRHDGWISTRSGIGADRESLPARLRLLIDGATGQVVRDA